MKLLCDHNVDGKYVDTFRQAEWLVVTTVREELSSDVSDEAITDHAARNGWVVSA